MSRWWVTPAQTLVTLFLFVEVAVIVGVSIWPSAWLWLQLVERLPFAPGATRLLAQCVLAALGYFGYGLTLLFVIPIARWVLFATGTPVGRYPYVSVKGFQWASYNALILIVRYSFINWIRATPFIVFFYRAMGMKAGKRVQINTAVVADCNLLSIGDDTVIGGDVTLIAHSVEGPDLITAPVQIGKNVTVGLMTVIFPGCVIEDGAVLAANSVLKKGTRIPKNEVWGGVPAKHIRVRS